MGRDTLLADRQREDAKTEGRDEVRAEIEELVAETRHRRDVLGLPVRLEGVLRALDEMVNP